MTRQPPLFLTFRTWFEANSASLDAVIFDIDGVLLVKGKAPQGSKELLELLRQKKFPFYLLTNDGDHSTEEKADILSQSGVSVPSEEIVSCSDGLQELFEGAELTDAPFFIMGNLGTPCFAKKAGLNATRDPEIIDQCQGIIVGERDYDWETTINAAVNFFIANPHAPLIVPNPDEYFPGPTGKICIGAGGVARFIARVLKTYGIIIAPAYLGKPFSPIFRRTHRLLEKTYGQAIPKKRILMIGDYINSDIKGAMNFGCKSAIVLTGVTTLEMLETSATLPDMVFERLG